MRTRGGYISRFVFRVCTLCMIGLRIGGAGAAQTETPAEKQRSPRTALGGRGRYTSTCRPATPHGRMAAGGARWPVPVAAGRSHNHTPRCTRAHTMIVSGLCALRPRIITQPFDPGRRDARCRAYLCTSITSPHRRHRTIDNGSFGLVSDLLPGGASTRGHGHAVSWLSTPRWTRSRTGCRLDPGDW